MALNLNAKHKAYMDILMLKAAHKKFKKSGGPSSRDISAAKKASEKSSFNADKAARTGTFFQKGKKKYPYQTSWSTATAKTINKELEKVAKTAINKELKKTKYKKIASVAPEDIVKNIGTAGAFAGVAAANDSNPQTQKTTGISRRALCSFGLFAGTSGGFLLSSTDEASADNKTYIENVKNGAKTYASKTATTIAKKAYGAGSRASIKRAAPKSVLT